MNGQKAIGIDLGTTYSCVGVFEYGKCEIIANYQGERITPSVVGFIDGQRSVGQWPKDRMHRCPLNVITCAKRLIGRKFDDPKVQRCIDNLPFQIISKDENTAIQIGYKSEAQIYSPEEISAMVLLEMKRTAITYLGGTISDTVGAVITIPAYFNDSQRQATIDAARIAGLTVLRIINEPTAAALAYGYKQKWKEGILLVYDLGGGTFDVSIIKITNGCCEVLAVDGDDHLGGEDIDNILVGYCVQEFYRQHGHDISNNARALCRLKVACEDAKRFLSNSQFASIEVEELHGNDDLQCKITQARFNELCKNLLDGTLEPVKRVLEKANICKTDIDNILLVGGSTRIPYIQTMLKQFFDNKNLNADINPDEAVAHGATLLAAHLAKSCDTSIKNIKLLDIIPRSLGYHCRHSIDDKTAYFANTLPRFTKFPCEKGTVCRTLGDNQKELHFRIYEGEDPLVEKNNFLGNFWLKNITPAPAGVEKIDVNFKIDENGVLTVTAFDRRNANSSSVTIHQDKGRLSEKEIIRMIDEINPPPMEIDLDDD